MMKILLVANTDWYLYRFRLALARALRRLGHQIVLVSPRGKYVNYLEDEQFQHIAWALQRRSLNPAAELISLLAFVFILQRERPQIVHLHTVKPVLYGSLAAGFLGIPYTIRSITGRGYIFLGHDWKAYLVRPFVRQMYTWLLRWPSGRVIFENESDYQFFIAEQMVLPQDAILIPGVGVDTQLYPPFEESTASLPLVVLPARLLWDKGVGTFVEAARLLRQRGVQARFALVGEPDPGNPASVPVHLIRQWVHRGEIEWWGWQSDMPTVFQQAHLVVLPSLAEGIPTALLEAAACQRAIVTTDAPGCRDVVQHQVNGLLVPPGDALALADAIQELLANPELRRKMGRRGRQIVQERFALEHIIEQTISVYQEALN